MENDTRLSRLEAIVENLARDVQDLKDIVIASSRTNWSVLASWAAVIIAIISLVGSGYIADINRLEKDAAKIDKRVHEIELLEAKQQILIDILMEEYRNKE